MNDTHWHRSELRTGVVNPRSSSSSSSPSSSSYFSFAFDMTAKTGHPLRLFVACYLMSRSLRLHLCCRLCLCDRVCLWLWLESIKRVNVLLRCFGKESHEEALTWSLTRPKITQCAPTQPRLNANVLSCPLCLCLFLHLCLFLCSLCSSVSTFTLAD